MPTWALLCLCGSSVLIKTLYIQAFRNLREVTVSLHPRLNILFGANGQGKTNLLEALYLLATLRSFRTHNAEEWIPFGQQKMALQGQLADFEVTHKLEVWVDSTQGGKKVALLDGKRCRTQTYVQALRAVVFVPEDLRLPKASPETRRQFLDRAVFHLYPSFLRDWQTYENVLRQRNAVLKQQRRDLLVVYDEQLAQAAARVWQWRSEYVEAWRPFLGATFGHVSQTGREASVRYRCAWMEERGRSPAASLREKLQETQTRDLETGYTHMGPHTDDLEFLLDGILAKVHASQGQTRALVLAAKMAEIQLLLAREQTPPLLLLDDVNSELDETRSRLFFEFLEHLPCQMVVTTTDVKQLPLGFPAQEMLQFHVNQGQIYPR